MKINKKQMEILENNFDYINTNYNEDDLYLETWTNGGVDMIIYLDKEKTIIENLEKYIRNFDIDEEIDLYRESKDYRDTFTIRESLEDFENWVEKIENIIKELEEESEG